MNIYLVRDTKTNESKLVEAKSDVGAVKVAAEIEMGRFDARRATNQEIAAAGAGGVVWSPIEQETNEVPD